MKTENYNKIMSYLDVIENELNKIASVVGHCSYKEFCESKGEFTGP